jgi:hypothetical protein
MKKLIGVLAIMMLVATSFAQDFKKVQTNILIAQFDAAKTEFDKVVAKKQSLATTAEGYYWAARIYSGLNKDATKYPNAYAELKKNIEAYIPLDPTFAIAKENGQDPFFDVYIRSFKDGAGGFNTKSWKEAAENFENAVKFSDIIYQNGWSTSKQPFDTTAITYAGYGNQNAGNIDQTLVYYKRLMDAKVVTPELLDVYRYVLIQLTNKKDKAGFEKYLAIAESAYPTEGWGEYKTEYIDKSYTIDEKVALFDQITSNGKLTEVEYQMFGDMFMAGKTEDNEASQKYILKATEAYKKAFEMNPKNFAVAFNIGVGYYNQYIILDEQTSKNIRALQSLNANKPAAPKDPKKKAAFDLAFKAQVDSVKKLNIAIEAPLQENVDKAIEWITKAFEVVKDKPNLVRAEKNVAGRAVDFLANLYSFKRDKTRGKDQKASDAYDAQYNNYDKLHDKYNN